MSIAAPAPPVQYVVTSRPGGGLLVTEDVDEALAEVRLIVDAGAQATVGKMRAEL